MIRHVRATKFSLASVSEAEFVSHRLDLELANIVLGPLGLMGKAKVLDLPGKRI